MRINDIKWLPVEAIRGQPNGTAFLWKHNGVIEIAELIGNLPTDMMIKAQVFGPRQRSYIKYVRKGKDTGVWLL